MQTNPSTVRWSAPVRRLRLRPRVRFSVTVAQRDAEPLRRALLDRLDRHIDGLVAAPGTELGTREARTALHVVMDRDAVDEALHIVMSTATSAQLGRVRRLRGQP